jgi:GTP 3',8-cyclase
MANISKYLRISITNKCNLKCFFCHKEGQLLQDDLLTKEDIEFFVKSALPHGYSKIKLTGGEPTVREDLPEIIESLTQIDGIELSLVTNGTLLIHTIEKLKKAGLKRFNVSLNTLNEDRFEEIYMSSRLKLYDIIKGIEIARKMGYREIKINIVYSGDKSYSDLISMLDFVKNNESTLVVLPVIGTTQEGKTVSLEDLYQILKTIGIHEENLVIDNEGIQRRHITMASGAKVILRKEELNHHQPYVFCDNCHSIDNCREGIFPIRLSSYGELIPCLANNHFRIDILEFIRNRDQNSINNAFSQILAYQKAHRGTYNVRY